MSMMKSGSSVIPASSAYGFFFRWIAVAEHMEQTDEVIKADIADHFANVHRRFLTSEITTNTRSDNEVNIQI